MFSWPRTFVWTVFAVAGTTITNSAFGDAPAYTFQVLYTTGQNSVYDVANNGAATGSIVQGGFGQATFWNPTGVPVTLNLATLNNSSILQTTGMETDGTQVVGYGNGPGIINQPFYWNPTSGAATILTPSGAHQAWVYGISGNQVVGGVSFLATPPNPPPGQTGPLLWTGGNASSAISLAPTQLNVYFNAAAMGTDGSTQVGQVAQLVGNGNTVIVYAGMWSGTAASFVSLNPTNLTYIVTSAATAVGNGQEVGFGTISPNGAQIPEHPLLWLGANSNAIDLLPAGFYNGVAHDTNGTQQVGTAEVMGGAGQAFVWSGSAASAVDLQSVLPASFTSSLADSIDGAGNVFGIAADSAGNAYVVEWSPVPEPGAGLLITLGCAGLVYRRRQKHQRGSGTSGTMS